MQSQQSAHLLQQHRALQRFGEEDVGTGGPDPIHGIYPTVKTITRTGFEEVPESEVRQHCDAVISARRAANGQA